MPEPNWREATEQERTQLWVMGETGNLQSTSVSIVLWPHGGKNPGPRQRITIQPSKHQWMKQAGSGSLYVLTIQGGFYQAKIDQDGNVTTDAPLPEPE